MVAPDDDRPLSTEELKAAVAHGHLPAVAERLARERAWVALTALFDEAAAPLIPLPTLVNTVRVLILALRQVRPGRRGKQDEDESRIVRLAAGDALLSRVPKPPMTEPDREGIRVAAAILADGRDLHRAAVAYEQAQDWPAAADAWGRMGELDQMEACLAREDALRRRARQALATLREVEALIAAGQRLEALRLAETIGEGTPESSGARQLVVNLQAHLARGRAVTLRDDQGRAFRFVATPALFGRDPTAEVPLRDPGVSRRHALLDTRGEPPALVLSDAGSRGGTTVAGARLHAPLTLTEGSALEAQLGAGCRLELVVTSSQRAVARTTAGLDRDLAVVAGAGALPLADLIAGAEGVCVEFDAAGAHLTHAPECAVRVGGHLVSTRVDLLHGDRVEVVATGVRLEVA